MSDYLCRGELLTCSSLTGHLFDSQWRVANVSLEGDVCKQAGLPVSFGGLGCRRAGDISAFLLLHMMNDVIKRALQKTTLPLVLGPLGLDRGDGSRPDVLTVFPFSEGRNLVWGCTCVDTFAGVHLNRSAMKAGTAANSTEEG